MDPHTLSATPRALCPDARGPPPSLRRAEMRPSLFHPEMRLREHAEIRHVSGLGSRRSRRAPRRTSDTAPWQSRLNRARESTEAGPFSGATMRSVRNARLNGREFPPTSRDRVVPVTHSVVHGPGTEEYDCGGGERDGRADPRAPRESQDKRQEGEDDKHLVGRPDEHEHPDARSERSEPRGRRTEQARTSSRGHRRTRSKIRDRKKLVHEDPVARIEEQHRHHEERGSPTEGARSKKPGRNGRPVEKGHNGSATLRREDRGAPR